MPSEQVIEKLEKLQAELDVASIAIKQIDDASKVANSASEILKKISILLIDLKSIEEKHRNDLLKEHKERIETTEKQLQLLLYEVNDKSQQLNELVEETKIIHRSITNYLDEIRRVNFPERLDKIDNQISSINIGLGNIHTDIQRSQDKIDNGIDKTCNIVNSSTSSINESIKHSQERITSNIINQLTQENQLLKNGIRANRIILIVGIIMVLAFLSYFITNKPLIM